VSDIDTAVVDSLKVLDPKRPIREADIMATRHERAPQTGKLRGNLGAFFSLLTGSTL
jgi:hypothetical protein